MFHSGNSLLERYDSHEVGARDRVENRKSLMNCIFRSVRIRVFLSRVEMMDLGTAAFVVAKVHAGSNIPDE